VVAVTEGTVLLELEAEGAAPVAQAEEAPKAAPAAEQTAAPAAAQQPSTTTTMLCSTSICSPTFTKISPTSAFSTPISGT
jgi:pyruvate/2-oxoglutarate dehydrogenase complex dihydrolipoamide acyltransferase (E2) component